MNHLINVYKHKCDQLQEHLNNLTKMLNEAAGIPPIPRFRGRPRISGIPDFIGPIGPRPHGPPKPNIPYIIRDIPDTPVNPNITPATHSPVPGSWTDLLNLANRHDPSRMGRLISSLSSDTGFMVWWMLTHGIVQEVNGIYQRLLNGNVFQWNNSLHTWQPINKPGYTTHFGTVGADGTVPPPYRANPDIIDPPNPGKPPPPTDPNGSGWNLGTNN